MPDRDTNFTWLINHLSPLGWTVDQNNDYPCLNSPSGYGISRDQLSEERLLDTRASYFEKWQHTQEHVRKMDGLPEIEREVAQLARAIDTLCDDGGLESWFAQREVDLLRWASRRSLMVYRYSTAAPRWCFVGLHPLGGEIWIEVLRLSAASCRTSGLWQVRDFTIDTATTQRHFHNSVEKNADIDTILASLDHALSMALEWTPGQLETVDITKRDNINPQLISNSLANYLAHLKILSHPSLD